jgi:hypothetical protein
MSDGTELNDGAVVSTTVTVKGWLTGVPSPSVAVHTAEVSPSGKSAVTGKFPEPLPPVQSALMGGAGSTVVSKALTPYVTLVALTLVASVVAGTSTRIGGGAALPVEMSNIVSTSRTVATREKRRKANPLSRET